MMEIAYEQQNSGRRCDHHNCSRIATMHVHESGHGNKPYWLCDYHWQAMMKDGKQIVLKRELPQDTEVEESCG